ncbi:hypothetical protein [Kribbella sp. NPDC048928]|uniref:competence protein CoiA family protein n=1 Tax=Kribbella sp. NPDC048928 TaxID=3364111 RepID=UPI00371E8C27
MAAKHQPEDYARWGIPRFAKMPQVYAVDLSSAHRRVVFLRAGGKDQPVPGDELKGTVAERTANKDKKHFHCLVDGCGPFSHVQAGSKRDGWVHPRDNDTNKRNDHSPESLWHRHVKHMFASWASGRLGIDNIRVCHIDDRRLPTPLGEVMPDVYIETVDGRRIAIEIQRSAGEAIELAHRHQRYESIGVIDWWIFSSLQETCKVCRGGGPYQRVVPTASQADMVSRGQSFYWFNHATNQLATPYSFHQPQYERRSGETWDGIDLPRLMHKPLRGRRLKPYIYFCVDDLDECDITPQGHLWSPGDERIARAQRKAKAMERGFRRRAEAQFRALAAAQASAAADAALCVAADCAEPQFESRPTPPLVGALTVSEPWTAGATVHETSQPRIESSPQTVVGPAAILSSVRRQSPWHRLLRRLGFAR